MTTAASADAEALADFVNAAYRGASAEAGWAHEAGLLTGQRTDPATLRTIIEKGHATILVLRDQPAGALLGCASVEPTSTAGVWYIGMVTIDPKRQAAGIGRTVLDTAERYAIARGAIRMRMTVIHLRNTLVEWYERRGYVLTGETEPFPYDDQRFGIPLRDDLYFVVLEKQLDLNKI